MGKRSTFARNPRDYYPTPRIAVLPLLPHLCDETHFIEPCAGDGRLIRHLEAAGHVCSFASDLEPQADGISRRDALASELPTGSCIITNPPWDRAVLHAMIESFRVQAPTWLLFDADWQHTIQAKLFLKYCRMIVSVGRVSWMENGTSGKDNCCWYLFSADPCATIFVGRA